MKKIYQLGFIASLIALLPSGMLFAGDGDGKDTKNTISIINTKSTGTQMVTLTVLSNHPIAISDIEVSSKTDGSTINHIDPVPGGVQVFIDVDHSLQMSGSNDGVIIIEIVGVDNITGVATSDGENGTAMPTSIVLHKDEVGSEGNPGNGSAGIHQNPNNSSTGNSNPLVTWAGNKGDVSVYPNPVVDDANVVTVGEILGKHIQVMDLSGHVVMNAIVAKGSRQTVLNLSALTPGIYILSYTTEDGKVISKKIQKI